MTEWAIEIGMWPTGNPNVYLGAMRVAGNGQDVIVSNYYWVGRPGPEIGFDLPDWVNPVNIANAALDAAKSLAKPFVYAAGVFTGGLPGLLAAWATDRAGVLDAIGDLLGKAGGVVLDVVASTWFTGLCSAVSTLLGVPEMALGCIIASLGSEVAAAVVNKDWAKIVDASMRLARFAMGAIDPVEAVKGLIEAVVHFPGVDIRSFVTEGFKSIRKGMSQIGLSAEALKPIDDLMRDIIGKYDIVKERAEQVQTAVAQSTFLTSPSIPKAGAALTKAADKLPKGPFNPIKNLGKTHPTVLNVAVPIKGAAVSLPSGFMGMALAAAKRGATGVTVSTAEGVERGAL